YTDPTQTIPQAPPPLSDDWADCENLDCNDCESSSRWRDQYREAVDDLILRSNVHDCRRCLCKDGTCRSRFPRDIFMQTEVDPADGYIYMRKREAMINTVMPVVTYTVRCNTDVTSLLSGTSIKAVVAYISDYITKQSLKIYHMFDTVKNVINKQ
ncbi:hypothetical protein B0H14DRAFT_2262146, partial [Mycena olivaceomarginata]